MSGTEFFIEQAERCAAEASNAELANQRDKFLAAEKAWRTLANGPAAVARSWDRPEYRSFLAAPRE
jgi:hypothetical protein